MLDCHCDIPGSPDNFSESSPLDAGAYSVDAFVLDSLESVIWNESESVYNAVAFFFPFLTGLYVLDHAVSVTDLRDGGCQMYRYSLERQSLSQE